jgi:hypothetical protein
MAEWLMAADCKSAALTCYGGSNPSLPTIAFGDGGQVLPAVLFSGNPRPGSPNPSAPRQMVVHAHVAQSVEHVLGKDGVSSSNLLVGSSQQTNAGVTQG